MSDLHDIQALGPLGIANQSLLIGLLSAIIMYAVPALIALIVILRDFRRSDRAARIYFLRRTRPEKKDRDRYRHAA